MNGQVFDLQTGGGIFRLGTVDIQCGGAAHHHVRQLLRRGVLRGHISDVPALAQDRNTVRDVHDLVELVGDDNERLAVCLHVPHDVKKPVRLLRGEDGRGLVQNEDVGTPVEYLDDLHRLLFRDRHIIDLFLRVDDKAVLVTDLPDLPGGGLQVQSALFLQTQHHVFRGSEHIHQLKMLMDHADAAGKGIFGRGNGHRLTLDVDLTLVREIDAGEHVHQRGLAAAVFAQQRQYFAAINVQPDFVVGLDGAEGLADVAQLDRGFLLLQSRHLH